MRSKPTAPKPMKCKPRPKITIAALVSLGLSLAASSQVLPDLHLNASNADDTSRFWNDLVEGNPSGFGLLLDKSPGNEVTRQAIPAPTAVLTHAFQFPGGKTGNVGGALLVASSTETIRSFLNVGWNTQPVSFEIWFKPDNLTPTATNGQILFEDGGGTGLGLFLTSAGLQTRKAGGGGIVNYSIATDPNGLLSGPATDEFIQAIFTYNTASGLLQLFVNGTFIGSATPGGNNWTGGDSAGFGTRGGNNTGGIGNGQSNTESFQGQIAMIRGYQNRILTPEEVEENYNTAIAPDTTPPAIVSFDPAAGATGIYPGIGQLVVNFDSIIELTGNGTVTIQNLGDGSGSSDLVINLPDASVVADDTNLSISLASNLDFGTQYAVKISGDAVSDGSGNLFAGIDDSTTWTLTTAEQNLAPPTIVTRSPDHQETGVWARSSIIATFDQPLILGTGNVVIKDLLDDSSTQTLDVTNTSRVTVIDNQLVIKPFASLENTRSYAVLIENTVVRNFSDVNFAGITADTQWNFTTSDLVPIVILISDRTPSGAPIESFFTDHFDNVAEIRHADFSNFSAQATQDALNGEGVHAGNGPVDVVVIGRSLDSPPYQAAADGYNTLTIPVINFTGYTARQDGNRLGWHASGVTTNQPIAGEETTVTAAGAAILGLADGTHNLVEGPGANFNGLSSGSGSVEFGDGQILATIGPDTLAAFWEIGAAPGSVVNAGVDTFPGRRLLFNLDNTPNVGNNGANDFNNLTPAGLTALANSIEFATPLVSLPTITGFDPMGAEAVYPGSVLVVNFNKNIALTGSGSITITDTMGSNDVIINLSDPAQVTVSGTQLIITPPANLAFGTSFEVVISDNTIQDLVSPPNIYGGTATGTWTFTTAVEELTAPAIVTLSPADNATRASVNSAIVATFDQNILLNSGGATVLYEEGFEDDNGDFSGTGDWEWGAPNTDNGFGLVLTAGNGGSTNAWATNLGDGGSSSGFATTGTTSILQGPNTAGGIELPAVALVQLEFAAAFDFAVNDVVELLVKEIGTDDVLVTLMPFGESPLTSPQAADWAAYGPFDISAAAGHNVYLEFRYQGNTNNYAGLYLDDFRITGQGTDNVITLRNLTDGVDTSIPASDTSQVAVDGNTLTITPATSLTASSDYAVRIGSGLVRNFSDIDFPGISDDTTWNFATATTPIITGVTIQDVSSEVTEGLDRQAIYVIDGSGFETNGPGTHSTSPDGTMWLTNGSFATPNDLIGPFPNSYIEFNLGDNYDLASFTVWNYNGGVNFTNRGANAVTISVASSVGGPFTSLGDFTFDQATSSNSMNFGQFIDLSGFGADNVRLIRFDITSSHGGNLDFVGLSEVRFEGSLTTEPGEDTFADWIASFPGVGTQTGLSDDPDGDGIPNGVENFFGSNPGIFSQGLVAGEVTGGGTSFTFTHPQGTLADDLIATYQWSTDLVSFQPAGTLANTTVAFSTSTVNGVTTVTADVSGTIPDNLFVRVLVNQN